ncbi:MAG TPA: TlpA disulfide reductase family protein [Mucilaginibacter sp.]|jgi:thiol-disulfide isomerase/thioredoxin|nr:TlpA disulfide reductase family protein [Mucilaginibacter sp.]
MKRIISIWFIGGLLFTGKINAQKIKINIVATGYNGDVSVFDPAVNYDPGNFISFIHLDKNGTGTYATDSSKPRYLNFSFRLPSGAYPQYILYLSPGDDLLFKINFTNKVPVISVSGKGANNNQPEIFALTSINLDKFKQDNLPHRMIAAIRNQEERNNVILKQYIKKYNPSIGFINNARLNCQYFALSSYYEFSYFKFHTLENSTDLKKWQRIKDSLLIKHPINNAGALTSFNYEHLTDYFQIQEPPLLMSQAKLSPKNFYRDWYHTTINKGEKIYTSENRNLFIERMINKYFSGKAAELVYAQMFRFQLHLHHYDDLDLVFTHFKHKYPSSSYIPVFKNMMSKIAAQKTQKLNNKMVFVTGNGTQLNTLEDVIHLMKGKTVFVDMWGTWCGPCRAELEKFTPQIRDHFKGKNITFLYIANKDIGHPEEWKKVIAYQKIEGTHILANNNLDKDIMNKVKSTSYPTHFLIKKDGSFKKIKTQDESNTQQVIKEIEAEM